MTLREWYTRWGVSWLARLELQEILESPVTVSERPAKPGTEAAVQRDLRLAAPKLRCLLFRNNVGVLKDARGIPVRFGLANDSARINSRIKSSDLVGVAPDGRFLAVETKAPGWAFGGSQREEAQLRFLNLIRARGGIGIFATSIEDLEGAL